VLRTALSGIKIGACCEAVFAKCPGAAEVNRATILNRTVVIEMLTHRAGDAACCPTRPATRRYGLAPRGLVLVTEQAKSRAGGP